MKWIISFIILCFFTFSSVYAQIDVKLPPGFHVNIYSDAVPGARYMALGNNGIVFVGTKDQAVYALIPNQDGKTVKTIHIADNLNHPNGVAFYKGDLYVAETERILRYPNIMNSLNNPPKPIVVTQSLPNTNRHQYRVLHFSPDDWLYVSVGLPCDTCNYRSLNTLLGTILRMRPDGSQLQVYAKGIRNSMGFDWHPDTKLLWFTDNGQDTLGDNIPPDEINLASTAGMDFGFPYVYGNNIPAPGYEKAQLPLNNFTPPAYNLPAHVAPLGMEFYTGTMFPNEYQNKMFVAEHGSWARSEKIGYQVVIVDVQGNKINSVKPFATGWLKTDETETARPVDILTMPDGALLISDDYSGKIYRVFYK